MIDEYVHPTNIDGLVEDEITYLGLNIYIYIYIFAVSQCFSLPNGDFPKLHSRFPWECPALASQEIREVRQEKMHKDQLFEAQEVTTGSEVERRWGFHGRVPQ